MIAPFAFLISSSLKVETQVFEYPIRWIPDPVRWMNYVESLTYKPFHIYFKNTMIIALLNQIAILGTASFCAYGFARIEFPGRDFWFGVALATMMLPYFVTMVPQFIIFSRLGWMDSYLPLTVPYFFGGGAFNIFLFRQFFRTFPEELADAARIDGCTEFGIYWRIFVPLAVPAFITVAIFTFMFSWNDFIGPLLYINTPDKFTVAIGLATYRSALGVGRTRWDLLMAASVAMTAPIVLLFFILQRYFIKGVVMTGIKG
ncbi:MAG TPA: sugar ABC transporter ATP-binding protein [Chloroflexi bacterium]|nr:sugar ABC transporter ATP-binding protein [Chloroflexota bacterium]